ncbi:MAG: hypothetical protein OEY59_13305, partial [Deltaproteobacteria bacterium]|nr:hypothetical protein [Deltaproteobacteria bacterium]
GAFGGATYLLYMLFTFLSAKKVATSRLDTQTTQFAEGIMFVFVGIFCTGQMAGYLIAPEYWLFIGVGICLSAKKRHHCYSYANLAGDRTRICTGF